ncbi:uroporphyrinogen-III C-methyltransferase [Halobacteriales archaeon QS_4_66_20]|nr:MAG: uroporphyrinogen-III C-methyltransferase [Halobacteriales archaeon QS_4_66_20]
MTGTGAPGRVYLAGAGPGDPELLTRKVDRLLGEADVVLHDALVSEAVLSEVPAETRTRDVGKRPGPDGERTTQEEINQLLVKHARAGETVLRLKGGDPTVFARGGEEADHLAAAGVPCEFVPGVSSVLGAPESADIPLTHRDHASSLTVVTGHEDPAKDDTALDWDALARTVSAGGTLVILMGVRRLPDIAAGLQRHGVAPETPAATVQEATLSSEQTVRGTVGTIGERIREAGIEPPATTIVGDVVEAGGPLADSLPEPIPSLAGGSGAPASRDGATAEER